MSTNRAWAPQGAAWIATGWVVAAATAASAGVPFAQSSETRAALNTAREIVLLASDDDASASNLAFSVIVPPSRGTWRYEYPESYPTNSRLLLYTPAGVEPDELVFQTAHDGAVSGPATCRVTVVANTAPVAGDTTLQAVIGTPATGTLNASDAHTPLLQLRVTIVDPPAAGTLTFGCPEGSPTNSSVVVYTPTNPCGGEDSFAYFVSDADLDSNVATCRVTVVSNTAPTVASFTAVAARGCDNAIVLSARDAEDSPVTITVVDPPLYGAWRYRPASEGSSYLQGGTGANAPPAAFAVIYTPTHETATNDLFTFKGTDGEFDSNVATCKVTIVSNAAPVASSQTVTFVKGQAGGITLSVSDAHTAPQDLDCTIVTPPTNGFWEYRTPETRPSNSWAGVYTPTGEGFGDCFTFQASDGNLTSAVATCSIVIRTNSSPLAVDATNTTSMNTPVSFMLAGSDPDTSSYYLEFRLQSWPSHGIVEYISPVMYPRQSYYVKYSPDAGWTGTDAFTFVVCDGMATSRVAAASVIVRANVRPVAYDLRGTVAPGAALTLAANFTDPDAGQTRTASVVDPPAHGQVVKASATAFLYTSDPDYTGEDRFTYQVSDGIDDSNVAACRVQVRPLNCRTGNLVIVVVQTNLYAVLSNEVERLAGDLANEGYLARVRVWPASGTTPSNLWAYLRGEYDATNQWLAGTILVGNIPKPQVGSVYTDLVYWNMATYQTDSEIAVFHIWASRFYVHSGTYRDEATLIRRALDVNHAVRTGRSRLPHTAYFYHAWNSSAAALKYGQAFSQVWPQVTATNEVSTDGHAASREFFPGRADIAESGADALVGGGEIFQETSHGNVDCYMNGVFVTSDLFRLGSQVRVCLVESCDSAAYGGIVNNHLFPRLSGTLWAVGGSDINYVGDFQLASEWGEAPAVRQRLAAGESWGAALAANYPFYARNRKIYYGDLSLGVMASPSNAMPGIVQFGAAPAAGARVGEPVRLSLAVTDPDAGADNPDTDYEHCAEWFPAGYASGMTNPAFATRSPDSGWTNVVCQYDQPHIYVARVDVRDAWGAAAWREATVAIAPGAGQPVRINAGHLAADRVDADGATWLYDQKWQAGTWGYQCASTGEGTSTSNVLNTADAFLYQSARRINATASPLTYRIPASNGLYTVNLGFADMWSDRAGQRIVDVTCENAEALLGFDACAAAGRRTVVIRSFQTMVADGELTLVFRRNPASGSEAFVSAIEVLPDATNRPPTVACAADAEGGFSPLAVSFTADAVDPDGDPLTYTWNFGDGEASEGGAVTGHVYTVAASYTNTVTVGDGRGGIAAAQVIVTVTNRPPAVGITVPAPDSFWIRGTSLWLRAGAADPDGFVTKVQFYAGTARISGDSTNMPYEMRWTNAPGGTSLLTARATDNRGAVGTSTVVTVNVSEDADGDGMPDAWETLYFGDPAAARGGPTEDWDEDGIDNAGEYRAGTSPTNSASRLELLAAGGDAARDGVLSWPSVAGRSYGVSAASDLLAGFTNVIQAGIMATPPMNVYTTPAAVDGPRYYRISLDNY